MFKRIKSLILDVRINLDFPRYERQQLIEHERQAQIRFSTMELDIERGKILKAIEYRADSNFNVSISEKEKEKQQYQKPYKEIDSRLSFFLRNYKEELEFIYTEKEDLYLKKRALYDELSKIKISLSEAFEEKSNAYSDLNNYKNKIDSWYAKSDRTPWLMGNSGRKIPKNSLFGQNLSELDSYKNYRDSAYKDVQIAKRRIENLKSSQHENQLSIKDIKKRISDLSSQMEQVKKDRSRMYELKKLGYQRKELLAELNKLKTIISLLSVEIDNFLQNKKEFIKHEKYRHGVVDIEAKICKIKAEQSQFLKSFECEVNKQNRKLAHRILWLKKRA